jgi:hypothetical protein
MRYLAAAAIVLIAIVAGMSIIPNLGGGANGGLPPTALNQIARRNDLAAAEAAASLRAKSEATARAADSIRDAEDRAREQGRGPEQPSR